MPMDSPMNDFVSILAKACMSVSWSQKGNLLIYRNQSQLIDNSQSPNMGNAVQNTQSC